MYKVLVHKGDYITYRLGERIITDRVDVLYKRHSKLNVDDTNVKSIKKTVGNVEGKPLDRLDELTHLYAIEIYDEKFNLLNSGKSEFVKCDISNSDDIVRGKMDISSVTTGVYNNGTTMYISSDNTDEGFIPEFRTILSRWFDVKVGEFIQHHSAIPTGLLNAKSKIKQSFIDGLADYIDDRYGAESIKNGMILDLLLEGYGKEFMISYRLLLETMNISYYSFMERTLVYEKGKILASRTFVDIFRDIALSNTQLVSLRRGESPSSKCYLLEVDEMVGVNGYKFVHK